MKAKYRKVPLEVSIHLRYLYQQQKVSATELCKKLMCSTASIYRHMLKNLFVLKDITINVV